MADRLKTRGIVALAAAPLLVIGLAGCTGAPAPAQTPEPMPTSSRATSTTPTPTPTPTPVAPTLKPGGSAAENEPFFTQTIGDYVGAYGRGERAMLVGHLMSAGFDSAMIESGWATTPNGLQEASIEVAVRFGDSCLIATVRDGGSTVAAMPVLSTGLCLIGAGFRDPA